MDTFLQEANDVYRYFRQDIGILKSPRLWILHPGSFAEVVNERVRQGIPREQIKFPHLSDNVLLLKEFEGKIDINLEL